MAVDHKRPFPVAEERLAFIAEELFPGQLQTPALRAQVIQLALMEAQVDALNDVRFFLSEAYDIYNARFR